MSKASDQSAGIVILGLDEELDMSEELVHCGYISGDFCIWNLTGFFVYKVFSYSFINKKKIQLNACCMIGILVRAARR